MALAVLGCLLFASPAAAQWVAAELFPNPPVPAEAGPHGLESLSGVVDVSPVARGLGRLRLQLPGGGTVEMARDGFERRRDGDVTWRGSVTGDEGSRVILTVKNGYMAGRVLHGLDEYQIRPGAGRSHVIERVDTSAAPIEEEHVEPPVDYSYDPSPSYGLSYYQPAYGNSPDNIQLMAVYTPRARAAAGGTPQIEVRIQSMVDQANAAFVDSGMIARIAIVHTEEVAYDEFGFVLGDLDWISGYHPDSSSTVFAKREFFGADVVSMIIYNGGQCAGAAYVMHEPDYEFAQWAYNVSALSCGAGTLAHEIGHNMGFEHNPEDSVRANGDYYDYMGNRITPSYPWSFGHYVDGSFRTIMSYPTPCLTGCPRALLFSNPDVDFLGFPTGILDLRDNARTGDLTAPIVADFMDAVTGAVVNRRVAASVEDVEELADGSVVLNSTTLELGDAGLGGVQAVGLRFQNINIPPGMRIDSAYLEFEAADTGSYATSVQIHAEASDNAVPFAATAFDVTGRPATAASVQWDIPAWTAATEKHYSPDISAVIQEIVDRPGWLEDNSMVLTVGGTGVRTALAQDGGAASAPLLHVEYASPERPETVDVPVAAFSYSCTGLTCSFTDQSTSSGGPIVSWSWSFNSDPWTTFHTSIERNPTVTFPAEGTYAISLEVFDDLGWQARTEQSFMITETGANIAPVATKNIYYTDINTAVSGNVLTDGIPDSDLDGDPLTVTANTDLSGGTLTLAANGEFTFTPLRGYEEYYFNYTISDGKGGAATAMVFIYPISKVTADFAYNCIELVCSFVDFSTSTDGDIVEWYWYFTDPSQGYGAGYELGTLYEQNPSFTFAVPGTYTVFMAAADSNRNVDDETKIITVAYVNTAPVAAFSYSCASLTCTFTDQSTDSDGTILQWSWSFGDGTYSYEQNPTVTFPADGSYSVLLDVNDDKDGVDNVQASVTVHAANTAPVATANAYTAYQENAVSGNVLTNGTPDSDADGDPLAVTANTSPLNGAVTMAANGDFTYTPAAGFTGTDSFTYTIGDSNGGSATATVTVTVNAITGPVAMDDAYTTDEDVAFSGNVLTDGTPDIAPSGSSLTVTANTNPLNGTLTMAATGAFTYTPNANFNGTDSFGYTISDGTATATATVTFTVNAVNDPPVATDNAYTTNEDTPVSGNFYTDGVPDSDIEGDTLTGKGFVAAESGSLSVQMATGNFTYYPKANFNGTDSFRYSITDGTSVSNVATVTITVVPVSDAPVAAFSHSCAGLNCVFTDGSTDADGAIASWAWDFGDGAVSTAQSPAHGYAADGTYTATLTVTDGQGTTDTVTQPVTVANTAPVATANAYTTVMNVAVSGNVLTDGTPDSDADGDALTVTANTNPTSGAVTMAASGGFTYTPNADFNGADSFAYTVSDGTGTTTASVTITVNAVNNAPVAAFTHSCASLNCTFTDSSTDIDGSIASWSWAFGDDAVSTVQNPAHSYAADGTYTVSLTVTDGQGGTATATQAVTVANTAPVATDDAYTTTVDTPVGGNVLTDGMPDSDADGDTLTVTANTDPLSGTVVMAVAGAFSYTPVTGFVGSDSFTYTISDGNGASATATVNITVRMNPVATDNAYTTDEDTVLSGNVLTDGTPDNDLNGDVLTVTANTSPSSGSLSMSANGAFTYTPNANFWGWDEFTYTVSNSTGNSATATVNITVYAVNDPPEVEFTPSCKGLNCVFATTMMDRDSIIFFTWTWDFGDGNTLTKTSAGGGHSYAADGTYTVTLTVTDSEGATGVATPQTVTVANNPPIAYDKSYLTGLGIQYGNVITGYDSNNPSRSAGGPDRDPDGDPFTVVSNTNSLNGALKLSEDGNFNYTAASGFYGYDSFTYTIADNHGATAAATVNIAVNELPDAHFGVSCAGRICTFTDTSHDSLGPISQWNWSFGDGGVSTDQNPSHTYPADDSYAVTLVVTDALGFTSTESYSIWVTNSAPTPTDDSYVTYEDTPLTGNVLTDGTPDSDPDGNALTITANTNPLNGTVTLAANGPFTYTPAAGFFGTDGFNYTVSDGFATATAKVTITVKSPKNTPMATDNAYTTAEDVSVSGNVLLDGMPDAYAEGDTLTVTANTDPLNGTVSVAADGTFTYTPNANFNGSDSFGYTIGDGKGGSDTATVFVTVNPVNDAPVATDNAFVITEGKAFSGNVLSNWLQATPDSDVDGDTLTVTANTSPLNGTLTMSETGTFTYSPAAGFTETDSFTYTISDGNGGSDTATVTIKINDPPVAAFDYTCVGLTCTFYDLSTDVDGTIVGWNWMDAESIVIPVFPFAFHQNPTVTFDWGGTHRIHLEVTDSDGATDLVSRDIVINSTPVATDNAYTTVEDTPVSGNVLTDGVPDSDAENNTLRVTANTAPLNGTVTMGTYGAFTYTPNPDFNGSDSFTYTVSDPYTSDTATVTITVNPVNDAPVATDNAYATLEDTAVSGNVLTDGTPDSDIEGDALTISANTAPLNGTVTVAASGAFTYTPNANFTGADSFDYTISDGNGGTVSATVAITVNPVNDAPVAAFSHSCTDLDCAFTDASTDTEGAIASWAWSFGDGAVSAIQNPAHSYAADGAYTVALTVTDGQGATDTVSQTVTVASAANTAPVATADAYTTAEDTAVSGNVLLDGVADSDADGDALTVTANTNPLNGAVTVAANGAFTYTPSADFNGTDSFTYTVSDGAAMATATVTVTVTPVNDAPVAVGDAYTTAEDVAVSGNVILDGTPDSDVEGDALTVTANTSPLSGAVTMTANGAFTYTPNADFNGSDSFTYTVSDGNLGSDTATVSITVTPVNDAPLASADAYTTAEDTAVGGNVLTDGVADSDADGDALTVTANTSPLSGTVTVAATGAFTYTPNADFNGTDSFTYTVSDGIATATATVTVTVNPVNDAPVATADAYTTPEDSAVSGNVLTDGTPDSDADGDALAVTANTNPLLGAVTVAASGAFTYTPNAEYNGSDSFTYTVSDGIATATATVTITVNPVNDAPVAAFSDSCAGVNCTFTDGSADIEGAIASWSWSFGDGAVSTAQNPTHSYAADGTYTVNLTATDGQGATDTVGQAVTVANTAPVATADVYTTDEDVALSGNVLTDGTPDSDADGDALTVTANTNPLSGTVAVAASGAFTYTPNADFNGADSFAYTVSDGTVTATASVTITVNPVNDAPGASFSHSCAGLNCIFTDGSADIEGAIAAWSWSFGDGAVSTAQSPTHSYAANGTYTVNLTVTDSDGAADTATQAVAVVNTWPIATDNAYTTAEDVATSGNLLTDGTPDSDADGDALTVTANTNPLNGTVTVAASGAFTYTPNADFNGTDGFTYTVSDGIATATATVTVTVTPIADTPVATNNAYATNEDVALSGNVLTDGTPDSDADGDALTVTANTNPLNGTVTVAASGAFTYTPNAEFNGSDGFTYTVSDGIATATATVTVTVSPVNDAPIAGFTFGCTDLDCTFADSSADIEGAIAAWSWDFGDGATAAVQSPAHSYAAVDGTYTVTLTVTDGQGATDSIAQSVTVVNPLPPAAPSGLIGNSTTSGNGANAVMAVTLSWTDNAINEEVFVVERCEVQGKNARETCSFAPVAELGADVTGYAESVPGNTSYRYRVKARNRNGESGYSNETGIPKSQI